MVLVLVVVVMIRIVGAVGTTTTIAMITVLTRMTHGTSIMKHQSLTAIIPMKGMKGCGFILPITGTSETLVGNHQGNRVTRIVTIVVVGHIRATTMTMTTTTMTAIWMLLQYGHEFLIGFGGM